MRTWIVVLTVLLAGLAPAARADLDVGAYAPDIEAKEWLNTDEPISLTEYRGMIVLIVFWVSWHKGGEFALTDLSILNSPLARQRGFMVIGATDAEKDKVEKMLKEKRILYPIATGSKAHEEYKISKFPSLVIVDPYGKVAWSGVALGRDAEMGKALEKVFEETPPFRTHPIEVLEAERRLKNARQALRNEQPREAIEEAKRAVDHTVFGDPLRARCQDMLDLAEALGRDALTRAQEAIDDRRYADAVALFREVRRNYIGLEVARTARKRLETYKKKYPEVARILERDSEEAQAQMELSTALDEFRARQFGPAIVRLERIAKDFPETDAAALAQQVIDRTAKNQGIMGYVLDHKASRECRSLLAQAASFERSRQLSRARQLYRQILDTYGDTVYADEAVRRLQRLP